MHVTLSAIFKSVTFHFSSEAEQKLFNETSVIYYLKAENSRF